MYCTKCGKELSDNDKCCADCAAPAGNNQIVSGNGKDKKSGCLKIAGWGFIIVVFFLGWVLIACLRNTSQPHPKKPLESYGINTSEIAKKMRELPVKVKFPISSNVHNEADKNKELMEIVDLFNTCSYVLNRSEPHWKKSFKQIHPKDLFKNCVCGSTTYILREKLNDGTISKNSRDDNDIMLDIIKNLVKGAMFTCKSKIEKKM